jgi:hypothetical protein
MVFWITKENWSTAWMSSSLEATYSSQHARKLSAPAIPLIQPYVPLNPHLLAVSWTLQANLLVCPPNNDIAAVHPKFV